MILEPPLRRFECPSCGRTLAKRDPRVTTEMHLCPAQKLLLVPFVELAPGQRELKKNSVRHVAVERGDYIAGEKGVRLDGEGRAVMAVHTERVDGYDCAVFAPCAVTRREEV
jgi:hypothetical protein